MGFGLPKEENAINISIKSDWINGDIMKKEEIFAKVDHTFLKPFASWEDIKALCREAIEYKTATVCVPPCYVRRIREEFGQELRICVVVGFPLGYCVAEAKVCETEAAIRDGADEVDMVINITDVKNGDYDKVLSEITLLKKACGEHTLKVIIETCYLTEEEKIKMCGIVTESGADFIKTSTGFGTGGATPEDIKLFKANVGKNVRIKAAGGMKTLDDIFTFVSLGADRLGTSSAVKLLEQAETD